MKFYKIIATTLLSLTSLTVVFAQDIKAKAVLDAASKKMATLKSLKASFNLKLAGNGGKLKDNRTGSIEMKGAKYHVNMGAQEIICDGKTVWTYLKSSKEVQITKFDPKEQTISPTKLFSNFYDKEFKYSYAGVKKVAGKDCDVIVMSPLNKAKNFTKIELCIDKSSTITGGNYWEKNGNSYQYEVKGFVPNAAISDADFVFDTKKHPGVEVVDLR